MVVSPARVEIRTYVRRGKQSRMVVVAVVVIEECHPEARCHPRWLQLELSSRV